MGQGGVGALLWGQNVPQSQWLLFATTNRKPWSLALTHRDDPERHNGGRRGPGAVSRVPLLLLLRSVRAP